jgi:hypothetical protein
MISCLSWRICSIGFLTSALPEVDDGSRLGNIKFHLVLLPLIINPSLYKNPKPSFKLVDWEIVHRFVVLYVFHLIGGHGYCLRK